MRTTVTLDPDVEKLLKDAMHSNKSNFKVTLNQAIRKGLNDRGIKRKKFKVKPFNLKPRSGFENVNYKSLLNDLDDADYLNAIEDKGNYGEK